MSAHGAHPSECDFAACARRESATVLVAGERRIMCDEHAALTERLYGARIVERDPAQHYAQVLADAAFEREVGDAA